MKMNELTTREREFLDKVNKINQKYCKDCEQSLWNVCRGYLKGLFNDDLLNESDEEIEKILKKVNENGTKVTKIDASMIAPTTEKKKKPSTTKKTINKTLF